MIYRASLFAVACSFLLPTICNGQVPPPVSGADFNQKLAAANARNAERGKAAIDSTNSVLPVDYFFKEFERVITVPKDVLNPPATEDLAFSMRDLPRKSIICDIASTTMLNIAEKNHGVEADYLAEWQKNRDAMLALMFQEAGAKPVVKMIVTDFFKRWESSVTSIQPLRFRDALQQAALSLARTGAQLEEAAVKAAQTSGPAGKAPAGQAGAVASGSLKHGGHWHIFWTRKMLHHYGK